MISQDTPVCHCESFRIHYIARDAKVLALATIS